MVKLAFGSDRTLLHGPGSRVRTRLTAGGRSIRTLGPPPTDLRLSRNPLGNLLVAICGHPGLAKLHAGDDAACSKRKYLQILQRFPASVQRASGRQLTVPTSCGHVRTGKGK